MRSEERGKRKEKRFYRRYLVCMFLFLLVLSGCTYTYLPPVREARVPEPVIPLKIFRNRTVSLTTIASFFVGVAMFGGTVFLSQYFQVALGKSPTVAGLMSLPMILGLLISSTVAGQIISATGRWKRYLIAGGVIMTSGLGLLATVDLIDAINNDDGAVCSFERALQRFNQSCPEVFFVCLGVGCAAGLVVCIDEGVVPE